MLSPVRLNDKVLTDDSLETLWVTVTSHGKQFIICSIYRPSSANIEYWHKFVKQVEYALAIRKQAEIIIFGDFKFHFNTNIDRTDKKLYEFANLLSLTQLVSHPTRVSTTSQSIIDLIFMTAPDIHSKFGVIPITISDHYLIFTVLNFKPNNKKNEIHN